MMTPKERSKFQMKLNNLITEECKTDAQYFERLCIALQTISNDMYLFKDDFYPHETDDEEDDEEEGDIQNE